DPIADLAELARLAERCERFSPIVGWKTADAVRSGKCGVRSVEPDCLFLDITGIGVLFGSEDQLGREVVADLARLGYEVRIAIADTIGAAWAAAKYGGRSTKDENGDAFVLHPSSFVLSALRLPAETIDLLSQLGIVQLEQLL